MKLISHCRAAAAHVLMPGFCLSFALTCGLFSAFLYTPTGIAQTAGGGVSSQRPTLDAPPLPLDWRKVKWPSLDYQRIGIAGGAALFTLHSSSDKRIRINAVFPKGIYAFPENAQTQLEAVSDLIVTGGAGKRSYEEIQNISLQQGVSFETRFTKTGALSIAVSGLQEDFDTALELLSDIVLRPSFEPKAFDIWKKEKSDAFQDLMDGSNSRKQDAIMSQEMAKIIYGPAHLRANQINRFSPKEVAAVSAITVKNLYKEIVNRAGSQFVLSGSFTKDQEAKLVSFIGTIPRQEVTSNAWLPERPQYIAKTGKVTASIPVKIIRKKDLTQCTISFEIYTSDFGKINTLERTQLAILREVYSSSGGVVGNDRFSKALRADTGISYSPHSNFNFDALEPNTNVGTWNMEFQSPNEKLAQAVQLASKTWDTFVNWGVTQNELDKARVSRMNRMMVNELTVFNFADMMLEDILSNNLPDAVGIEGSLGRLEKVTDPKPLNALLRRFAQPNQNERYRAAVVVFGNPSAKELSSLAKGGKFKVIADTPFEKIVEELQK